MFHKWGTWHNIGGYDHWANNIPSGEYTYLRRCNKCSKEQIKYKRPDELAEEPSDV